MSEVSAAIRAPDPRVHSRFASELLNAVIVDEARKLLTPTTLPLLFHVCSKVNQKNGTKDGMRQFCTQLRSSTLEEAKVLFDQNLAQVTDLGRSYLGIMPEPDQTDSSSSHAGLSKAPVDTTGPWLIIGAFALLALVATVVIIRFRGDWREYSIVWAAFFFSAGFVWRIALRTKHPSSTPNKTIP